MEAESRSEVGGLPTGSPASRPDARGGEPADRPTRDPAAAASSPGGGAPGPEAAALKGQAVASARHKAPAVRKRLLGAKKTW